MGGFIFDVRHFCTLDWRTQLDLLWENINEHNLHVTDENLRQIPACEFWRKLMILFLGNDAPKYTLFTNPEMMALFFALYDPLSHENVNFEIKWKLI